jgi:hypothetical protein
MTGLKLTHYGHTCILMVSYLRVSYLKALVSKQAGVVRLGKLISMVRCLFAATTGAAA